MSFVRTRMSAAWLGPWDVSNGQKTHVVSDERSRRVGRASGATRTSTVIATVLSRLATLRPARPRAQASLPPRRQRPFSSLQGHACGPRSRCPERPWVRFSAWVKCTLYS